MIQWFVAETIANRYHMAPDELLSRGAEVKVPIRYWKENVRGVVVDKWVPLLRPYFFVRFNGADDDEHAFIKKQRGMRWVLLNGQGKPSPISDAIIKAHHVREHSERAETDQPKGKRTKSDLVLLAQYVIKRNSAFEGKIGTLIAVDRGIAHLDWEGMIVKIPDCDIGPAELGMRAGVAA